MTLIALFFLASAAGFLLEVGYARLMNLPRTGRKCLLFFPLCPVYGAAAVVLTLLPEELRSVPALFALLGGCLATATEYLFSLYYEKRWHVRFWDYSQLPFQLAGRVSLIFSLIWGGLILLCFPPLLALAGQLVGILSPALLAGLVWALCFDWMVNGLLLRRTGDRQRLRWWLSQPGPGHGQERFPIL